MESSYACTCTSSTCDLSCTALDCLWENASAWQGKDLGGFSWHAGTIDPSETMETLAEACRGFSVDPAAASDDDLGKWSKTCQHAADAYELGNGATVYASAHHDRLMRTFSSDVQVWLDEAWMPEDLSYCIGWPDFGVPYISERSIIRVARLVLDHCERGESVEIGCLGAHGRTGTFLAILEIVSSAGKMTRKRAIDRVRQGHCKHAIETREQERYIGRIRKIVREENIRIRN